MLTMDLSNDTLKRYTSPYTDWHSDFIAAMESMVTFGGDQDQLLTTLYNVVLPFVKHEYTVYDSLLPAIHCFGQLVDHRPELVEPVTSFLCYVFQEPIRDSNMLLVDPVQCRYLAPDLMAMTVEEAALFESAKAFYASRRSLLSNLGFRAYYDTILLDHLDDGPPSDDADERAPVTWLLATAIRRFKHREPFIVDAGVRVNSKEFFDLCEALQGRHADQRVLLGALENDTMVMSLPWAAGRLGAIAGLTMFMAAKDGSSSARILAQLIESCARLKQARADANIDMLMTDQLLLEDLSVVLFREHLKAKMPLTLSDLNAAQRVFLDLLKRVYRGHTYSLLYAGVAPEGTNVEDFGLTSSVYEIE